MLSQFLIGEEKKNTSIPYIEIHIIGVRYYDSPQAVNPRIHEHTIKTHQDKQQQRKQKP